METKVCAKINLSLAIVGKKDNMHMLDMIFYPVEDLFDVVKIDFNKEKELKISNISTELLDFDEDRFINFINKKLVLINKYFGVGGNISIIKNVPLGGGLGGSSTVLAGIIKCIEKELNKKADISLLLSLGSDVPYFTIGGAARVKGIGDIVEPIEHKHIDFELKFVEGGVDTQKCYALYDELGDFHEETISSNIEDALLELRNDLFKPACMLNENMKKEYDKLVSEGKKVLMTGSGSTLVIFKQN